MRDTVETIFLTKTQTHVLAEKIFEIKWGIVQNQNHLHLQFFFGKRM